MTWDYPKTEYEKQKKADPKWHLERLIRNGLGKERLNRKILERYLPELTIPGDRKAFLEFLLWGKKQQS